MQLNLCAILLVVLNVILLISLLAAGIITIMGNQPTEMETTFNGLSVKSAVSQVSYANAGQGRNGDRNYSLRLHQDKNTAAAVGCRHALKSLERRQLRTEEHLVKEHKDTVMEGERAFYEETAKIEKIQKELQKMCESGSSNKPAAHFGISKLLSENGRMQKLQWKADSNLSHGDVQYESGGIKVPLSGYYYIYTTIRYVGHGTEELDFGRILHNVLMKKVSEIKETPTILMQNLQSTPTIRRGREAFTTSNLGSTFFLQANSTVMVNSSLVANIDTSPLGSYFGLFLM